MLRTRVLCSYGSYLLGDWIGCRTGNGWKVSIKEQLIVWSDLALPGCCLVSIYFLYDILISHPVQPIFVQIESRDGVTPYLIPSFRCVRQER